MMALQMSVTALSQRAWAGAGEYLLNSFSLPLPGFLSMSRLPFSFPLMH